MKVAKTLVLEYLEQEFLKNNKQGLETKVIAAALGMQRSNVSTILNQLVKEGIFVKGNTRPVQYQLKEVFVENPLDFPSIIGRTFCIMGQRLIFCSEVNRIGEPKGNRDRKSTR